MLVRDELHLNTFHICLFVFLKDDKSENGQTGSSSKWINWCIGKYFLKLSKSIFMHTETYTCAYTCYLHTGLRLPHCHCLSHQSHNPTKSERSEWTRGIWILTDGKSESQIYSRAAPPLMKCCFTPSISHHQFSLSSIYCISTASYPWCEAWNCRSRALHSTARPHQIRVS